MKCSAGYPDGVLMGTPDIHVRSRPGSAPLWGLAGPGAPGPSQNWAEPEAQYGGKSAYHSPSLRNAVQNARLADSSSSALSMSGT